MSDTSSISSLSSADLARLNESLRRTKLNQGSLNHQSGQNMDDSCMSWLVPLMVLVGMGLLIYLIYNYSQCSRRRNANDDGNSNRANGVDGGNGVYVISNMTNNGQKGTGSDSNNGQVVDIDGDQLEQKSKQGPIIVAFFAQGCGWCVKAKPALAEAAKSASKQIHSLHAHSKNGMEQCKKYGVKGFPTIKYVHNGHTISEYMGDRSAADIVNWVKSLK